MLFDWDKNIIRWYTAANEYTGFYRKIAGSILPSLAGCETLCDLGCGLGLIDLELCHALKRIDCIDINAKAVASLIESIKTRGIENIFPGIADCGELDGSWDAVFMSFFGSRELDRFLPCCKKLIAVVHGTGKTEMCPATNQNHKRNTVEDTERYLIENGIRYRLTLMNLEFGQPFISIDDARDFIKCHAPETTADKADEFLSRRLKRTDNPAYPLFMPRVKALGIFELEGEL